jgi:hypothetical protein
MRALTLTQPWATLIACGAKRIETRSWSTGFRGVLAIHAAKGLGPVGGKRGFQEQCATPPFDCALGKHLEDCGAMVSARKAGDAIPLGAIVATVRLVDVKRINLALRAEVLAQTITPFEIEFGDYADGRYAWFLEDVHTLPEPVYCNGALSLWDVPEELQTQIFMQQEGLSEADMNEARQAMRDEQMALTLW